MRKFHKHFRDKFLREYKTYKGTAFWSAFGSAVGLLTSIWVVLLIDKLNILPNNSLLTMLLIWLGIASLLMYYCGSFFAIIFYLGGLPRELMIGMLDPLLTPRKATFNSPLYVGFFDTDSVILSLLLRLFFIIAGPFSFIMVPFYYPYAIRRQVIAHKYCYKELPYQF